MHYTAWYHRIARWLHLPCFISRCFVKYIVSEYVSGHSGAPLLSNSLQVHSSLGVPKLNNLPADVFSQSIFCNHFSLSYLFELKSQAVQIMQLTEVAQADAGWWWGGVGRRIYQVINNAIPWEIFQSRFSGCAFLSQCLKISALRIMKLGRRVMLPCGKWILEGGRGRKPLRTWSVSLQIYWWHRMRGAHAFALNYILLHRLIHPDRFSLFQFA